MPVKLSAGYKILGFKIDVSDLVLIRENSTTRWIMGAMNFYTFITVKLVSMC